MPDDRMRVMNSNATATHAPPKAAYGGFASADEQSYWRDYEPLRDAITQRAKSGLGFMPWESPEVTYNQSQDQTTGDGTSRGITVKTQDPLARLAGRYAGQINAQLGRDMATENVQRGKTRAAVANQASYNDPRLEQTLRYETIPPIFSPDGRMIQPGRVVSYTDYKQVNDSVFAPFLPMAGRFS